MKRLIGITGIILIGCVCISSIFAQPAAADTSDTAKTVQVQTASEEFLLKAENNRLVVYRVGQASPYLTTDTKIDSLPKSDAVALESGVEVHSEQKLRRILEDYCS